MRTMTENENKIGSVRLIIRVYRFWNKLRDRFAASLSVDTERKIELYLQLSRSATLLDLVYWLQILFSSGIATLGLVLNSPAVIIGAMLISPLMNPILASGLALATGDLILGTRSILSLFLSSVVSIGFAFLLVALLPFKEQTTEILSRTSPNTLDLGIALFSGAIGSIVTCREIKGAVTSIPGVAIAVALMPPLCVIGYGIGLAISFNFSEGLQIAKGGGLLYLTNLVAITFTAMIVLVLLRIDTTKVRKSMHDWRENDGESRWFCNMFDKIPTLEKAREIRSFSVRLVMILLPLTLIIIPLSQSFSRLKAELRQKQSENLIEQKARDLWEEFYASNSNGDTRSFIDDLSIDEKEKKLNVYLRVFDNTPYTPEEKSEFVKLLASHLNRPMDSISLQLTEVPTSARNSLEPKTEKTPPPSVTELQVNYIKAIESSLNGLIFPAPAKLLDYRISNSPSSAPVLQVFYLSDREISPDALDLLTRDIDSRLNLSNASVLFERIPTDAQKIPFLNGGSAIDLSKDGIWRDFGRYLRQHQRLRLVIKLYAASKDNQKSIAEKQEAVKTFFIQNWEIDENRMLFSESESEADSDTFRIVLPE